MSDELRAEFFANERHSNARNLYGSKEEVRSRKLIFFSSTNRSRVRKTLGRIEPRDGFEIAVDARWWMSRSPNASVVYCSVWAPEGSGYGTASGYAYCKHSAALDEAIRSAGYRLSRSIHGEGSRAIDSAMLAIAGVSGWRKTQPHIFV